MHLSSFQHSWEDIATVSDDPQRIPNWVSRLLQETEDVGGEERQIAGLHAEATGK